jgi:uncharacterized protein YjiS (DUF1127 family)
VAPPQANGRRGRTLFAWHARSSDRQRLLAIDGHMLRDIGVTKIAVQQEAMKPFWRN